MKSDKARPLKAKYYVALAISSLVYLYLTYAAPLGPNVYNISTTETRLLQLTLVVPILIIWVLATYGVANFKYYSNMIHESPDGKALDTVSNGLTVLVGGTIVQSLFAGLRPWYTTNHIIGFTHINLLLTISFPLVAFYLVWAGSAALMRLARQDHFTPQSYLAPIVTFTFLSSLYTWAILSNPYRNTTPDVTKFASYFMSDPYIVLLVIVPIVTTWLLGVLAATSVRNYHQSAKGSLYKQAMAKLAYGLFSVVLFSILIQFFTALGPSLHLSSASLKAILIIIYVILVLYAVGYAFIASGAKRLSKIEEVQ